MTEAEWLACEDPLELLRVLLKQNHHRRKAGRRKLRLVGCAGCRRGWADMTDPRSRAALEFAERWADGGARDEDAAAAMFAAGEAASEIHWSRGAAGAAAQTPASRAAFAARRVLDKRPDNAAFAHWAMNCSFGESAHPQVYREWRDERGMLCEDFRDIFGNPFRPVAFSPTWQTSTALSLAKQMYEARDFSAMPILADALQDAGCDNEDILSHCRGEGPHVRGCWVVDLVLGKG
jgi:hypothetical protein